MEFQRRIVGRYELYVKRSKRLMKQERLNYNYKRPYVRKRPYFYKTKTSDKQDFDNDTNQDTCKIETSKLLYCARCRLFDATKKCSRCNEKLYDEQDFDNDDTIRDDESFHTEDYRIDSSSVSSTPDEKLIA